MHCAVRATVASAAVAALAGCGGGAALLHGAHVLDEGETSAGAGVSGTFVSGSAASDLTAARAVPLAAGAGGTPTVATAAQKEAYAKGAAAVLALGPGVAPWIGARVGLPYDSEAGLTFTGRQMRIDGRHAFESERFALSIGLGLSAVVVQNEASSRELAGLGVAQKAGNGSLGFDVPVLAGWRSRSDIVSLWIGPRFGLERMAGEVTFGTDAPPATGDLSIERWYYGGVAGLSVGFRHLHAAIEVDAYGQSYEATLAGNDVKGTGLTVAPSAALLATF